MKKKGATLVEVVVAMGLFAILATVIVGAFVVVLNMKALTSTMKETQQKLRMALEITSRLGRQAKNIKVLNGNQPSTTGVGDTLELYFENNQATKFVIGRVNNLGKRTLYTQDCITVNDYCSSWSQPNDLLGGEITLVDPLNGVQNRSEFAADVSAGNTPTLTLRLYGRIDNANTYYSNDFNIENVIILESLPWAWNL
jgi:type II secretory pathway pseudopilin PulG